MNNEIKQLVEAHVEDALFTYASPTEEAIRNSQDKLALTLPDQYLEYLETYGHGGIGGVEILGFGLDGSAVFVDETLEQRGLGLRKDLVVVEDVDEWVYCIDCGSEKIISWSPVDGERAAFNSFDEFVLSEFSDAIENL